MNRQAPTVEAQVEGLVGARRVALDDRPELIDRAVAGVAAAQAQTVRWTSAEARLLTRALSIADDVQAGAVVINGSNAWRVDAMPFGGVGNAGFGREGVRYMVEEITDRKAIVIRRRQAGRA